MREGEAFSSAGFALVEVMMAACLLIAVAVGASQLSAVAVRATYAARARTMAAVLAAQKMEQLRSLRWTRVWTGTSPVSVRVSDITTDLSSEPPSGAGRGLLPSPAGTLDSSAASYADYLNAAGAWVGHGVTPPETAVYIRRWAIQPLESNPDDVLVLQVVVTTTARSHAHESRLVSVLTRKP
jgi:hypothetical protein